MHQEAIVHALPKDLGKSALQEIKKKDNTVFVPFRFDFLTTCTEAQ